MARQILCPIRGNRRLCVWADLENVVSQVPSSDYLFVLIYAYARAGVRMGEEDCKVIGAYGRDTRVSNSNGTSLLRFAGDNVWERRTVK